jgi:hypothetical protein
VIKNRVRRFVLYNYGRCRTQEKQMFDIKAILGAAGREGTERWMHDQISDRIKAEIAKGKNARNAAADFLVGIRDSQFLKIVQATFGSHATGIALTTVAAGFVKWLQMIDWSVIGIEDQSPVMREVRFILQHVLPGLLVGSAEGLSDTFDTDVAEAIAKIRSDDSVEAGMLDTPQKVGAYDFAYEVLSEDGIDYWEKYSLFFPERNAEGKLQYDQFGAVILSGPAGKKFALDWYATHKGDWRDVPIDNANDQNQGNRNGRGNQNNQNNQPRTRKQWFPVEPYKGREVPLATALMRMPVSVPMDPELIVLAKAALAPKEEKKKDDPKDEQEKVDDAGDAFMKNVAKSINNLDPIHQRVVIDFIQDVSKAIYINKLGKQFVPEDGRLFSADEMKSIWTYIHMWMGGKLTFVNKVRVALEQANHMLESGEGWMKTAAVFSKIVGKWTFRIGLAATVLFLVAALMFLVGGLFLAADNSLAIPLVLFGGGIMIAELFSFTPIQASLDVLKAMLPSLKEKEEDWLVNKGRILIMFIGLHMAILMMLLFIGASPTYRFAIFISTITAIAINMGLNAYGFKEEARLRTRRTLRLFGVISTFMFAVIFGIVFLKVNGYTAVDVKDYFMASKLLTSLLVLVVSGYAVAKIIRKIEVVNRETLHGEVINLEYRSNWWLRGVGIAFVLFLAAWPWVGDDINAFFAKKTPGTLLTTVREQPKPVAAQPVVAAPVVEEVTQVSEKKHTYQKSSVKKPRAEDECDSYKDYSAAARKRLGCE